MSIDERAGGPSSHSSIAPPESLVVEPDAREDRPTAPADPRGTDLFQDMRARVAELDAIAWNLPSRGRDLVLPPDDVWPAERPSLVSDAR